MKKTITILAVVLITTTIFAQVPSYVPTNGLIGWYPFNGNANDASGSGNNGILFGPTATADRFSINNSAYNFNGTSDYISVPNIAIQGTLSRSTSFWVKTSTTNPGSMVIATGSNTNQDGATYNLRLDNQSQFIGFMGGNFTSGGYDYIPAGNTVLNNNIWHNVVATFSVDTINFYIDGIFEHTVNLPISTNGQGNFIGKSNDINIGNESWFAGIIDDIGIWNRVLTQQEITNLYTGNICITNITVTDTLLINTTITGYNPITYLNTIKVYPNPSHDHITIDNGNLATLNGYQMKITNSLGQIVFQNTINQQQFYLSLTGWTGNGLYFLYLIDGQGNIIDIRKIVLQ